MLVRRREPRYCCVLVACCCAVALLLILRATIRVLSEVQCSESELNTQPGSPGDVVVLKGEKNAGWRELLTATAFTRNYCGVKSLWHGGDFVLSGNMVVSQVTDPMQVSSLGWWLAHAKVDMKFRCEYSRERAWDLAEPEWRPSDRVSQPDDDRGIRPAVNLAEGIARPLSEPYYSQQGHQQTCALIMANTCSPNRIHAYYQYIGVKEDFDGATHYQLSLLASTIHATRHPAAEDHLLGMLALALFADGTQVSKKLHIEEGTYAYTKFTAIMVLPTGKTVSAFLLMVGCYGYSGHMSISNVAVRAIVAGYVVKALRSQSRWQSSYVPATCPPVLHSFIPAKSQETELRQWTLYTPVTQVSPETVTLVTQASLDRIDVVQRTMQHWHGPVSLVLYVPNTSTLSEPDLEWKKIYVKKKLQSIAIITMCSVRIVFGQSAGEEYPINELRNIAIRHSPTETIFLLDADFVPSPNFNRTFWASVSSWFNSSEYKSSLVQNRLDKTAFVVPAFEFDTPPREDVSVPMSKQELVKLVQEPGSNFEPFKYHNAPLSHKPVDYPVWYMASEPYTITTYQDKFEPYLVLRKTQAMPAYDESFRSYGMNKVSHTIELSVAGYQFVVLPNAWAVHLPHHESASSKKFMQDPYERLKNRLVRFQFILALQHKYNLTQCVTAAASASVTGLQHDGDISNPGSS
ncbi:uncharacterized protein LOC135804507 isoform X1 [Sycon ciliatum]|uniref:uncharacterized protein LOC135804507 isoform X1 n=2 Tax=Sycon ciliatum TaxID=27933 RepID=UPI0031F6C0B9